MSTGTAQEKRNSELRIRLSAEEKRFLMSEAKRLNVTLSSLIRRFILTGQTIEK
jgi:hypothetical protein